MRTYYIEYKVHDDAYRYCAYITADSWEDAIATFKSMESDLKEIIFCILA